MVAVIFALFQVRDTSVGDIVFGAGVATSLQALVTAAYLLYLQLFADVAQTYGASSLATTVLLGFWLLLSNACLLLSYRLMLRRCSRRQSGDGQPRAPEAPREAGRARRPELAEPAR